MSFRAVHRPLLVALLIAAWPALAQQAAPTLPPYLRQGLVPNWIDPNAQVKWPPNDGCAATPEPVTLPVGTLIDRFGSEGGHYFSPKGESFAARALPYVCSQMVFTVYRVAKPLPVTTCKTAPWFGEPGGATQYQTAEPAFKLRETGSIEVATGDGAGNDEPASPCRSS